MGLVRRILPLVIFRGELSLHKRTLFQVVINGKQNLIMSTAGLQGDGERQSLGDEREPGHVGSAQQGGE